MREFDRKPGRERLIPQSQLPSWWETKIFLGEMDPDRFGPQENSGSKRKATDSVVQSLEFFCLSAQITLPDKHTVTRQET